MKANKKKSNKQKTEVVCRRSQYLYYQDYRNYRYKVCDLIDASKNIKVENIPIGYIDSLYEYCLYSADEACEFVKVVQSADTSFAILLSPEGFVLDGKHRLVKARLENAETIKVKRFETMPDCGAAL